MLELWELEVINELKDLLTDALLHEINKWDFIFSFFRSCNSFFG